MDLNSIAPGGGSGLLSDVWTIEAPRDTEWPTNGAAGRFIEIYDWDIIVLPIDVVNIFWERIELCSIFYPCSMVLKGSNHSSSLERRGNGSIACLSSSGCSMLSLNSARVVCNGVLSSYPVLDVESASLYVHSVTFIECSSESDGGGVRCYGAGGLVEIYYSSFNFVKSEGMGGAISAIGCSVFVDNCIFRSCAASRGGGAISGSQFQCYGSNQDVQTLFQITSCLFEDCRSESDGGAMSISSSAASATIIRSVFSRCQSNSSGGSLAVIDSAAVQFVDNILEQNSADLSGGGIAVKQMAIVTIVGSSFSNNFANNAVGGAIYASEATLLIKDSAASGNSAQNGAGGAIYWDGSIVPTILEHGLQVQGLQAEFCGVGNHAIYGDCLASAYASLHVSAVPTQIFPGLPFLLVVTERDAYNQTILTDSDSVVETATSVDNTYKADSYVGISGSYISSLDAGQVSLSIILKPSFTKIDSIHSITQFKTRPAIYFRGLDAENGEIMQSAIISITMESGASVCPPGFILVLDQSRPGSNQTAREGACTLCASGTYSVNPLAGPTTSTPACFNCFSTAICSGGYNVQFKLGTWVISGGMYTLVGCPLGYELVNSIGGVFSHDVQGCIACDSDSYILNPNNSNYTCQTCPVGAVCNGNSLTSRVSGAVWVGDTATGQYLLVSCPAGYVMQAATLDGQQCLLCPATYYCVGGSAQSSSCQDGTYSPPGTNSSSYCLPVVYVSVALDLPLTQDEFTTTLQASLQQALAAAAGVRVGFVMLSSISAARRSTGNSIQVLLRADTNTRTGTLTRTSARAHAHTYTRTHARARTHTHAHTHTHTDNFLTYRNIKVQCVFRFRSKLLR